VIESDSRAGSAWVDDGLIIRLYDWIRQSWSCTVATFRAGERVGWWWIDCVMDWCPQFRARSWLHVRKKVWWFFGSIIRN